MLPSLLASSLEPQPPTPPLGVPISEPMAAAGSQRNGPGWPLDTGGVTVLHVFAHPQCGHSAATGAGITLPHVAGTKLPSKRGPVGWVADGAVYSTRGVRFCDAAGIPPGQIWPYTSSHVEGN